MNDPISDLNLIPSLNIGAVSRMTGIPITSLHAWERRYGFPHQPARTPGGHRLYTGRDVTLLRCVKAQIDQGVSAHQAVISVVNSEKAGTIPVDHPIESSVGEHLGSIPSILSERLNALLAQNKLNQTDLLLEDMANLYTMEDLVLKVIGPAYEHLGIEWQQGRLTVAEEHLASNYLRQKLMLWMESSPNPTKTGLIGMACAPEEWHEGSLLMLAVLLRYRGWPVAYLGQNVPLQDLGGFVQRSQPKALVFVAMTEVTAKTLSDWPSWIAVRDDSPLVTFGGRAFIEKTDLVGSVRGHYLGDSIGNGLDKLIGLLK